MPALANSTQRCNHRYTRVHTSIITSEDDLTSLVSAINTASWDATNEMHTYDVTSLSAYLDRQDTVFVACHDAIDEPGKLLGIASARIEMKPYNSETWLYVDEIDVCADHRRQGVGTALMECLVQVAELENCSEVWLGAAAGDIAANALYRSLDPTETAGFVGYTYETD